jgi:hypothetical protein
MTEPASFFETAKNLRRSAQEKSGARERVHVHVKIARQNRQQNVTAERRARAHFHSLL